MPKIPSSTTIINHIFKTLVLILISSLNLIHTHAPNHTSFSGGRTSSNTLKIQKGDITRWFINGSSDAIVNPANERMLGGGSANGAIHRAIGPELRTACYDALEVRPSVRYPTGEARITQYAFDEAATVAISTIKEHCGYIKEVHFVLFEDNIYNI